MKPAPHVLTVVTLTEDRSKKPRMPAWLAKEAAQLRREAREAKRQMLAQWASQRQETLRRLG